MTKKQLHREIYRLERELKQFKRMIEKYLGIVYSERELYDGEGYKNIINTNGILDMGIVKEYKKYKKIN